MCLFSENQIWSNFLFVIACSVHSQYPSSTLMHSVFFLFRAVSVLKNYHDEVDSTIVPKGKNVGHDIIIEMQNKKIQEETYKPVSRNETKFWKIVEWWHPESWHQHVLLVCTKKCINIRDLHTYINSQIFLVLLRKFFGSTDSVIKGAIHKIKQSHG